MQVQWRLAVAAGVSLLVHAVFIMAVRPLPQPATVPDLHVVLETGASSKPGARARAGAQPQPHQAQSGPKSKTAAEVMQVAKGPSPVVAQMGNGPSTPAAVTAGAAPQPGEGSGTTQGSGTAQGSGAPSVVQAARFLGNASHPPYPEQARLRGEQGRVELKVRIGRDAQVKEVLVLRSSGFPQLDDAAQSLLRNGPFAAARKGDVPIESWLRIAVPFTLQ